MRVRRLLNTVDQRLEPRTAMRVLVGESKMTDAKARARTMLAHPRPTSNEIPIVVGVEENIPQNVAAVGNDVDVRVPIRRRLGPLLLLMSARTHRERDRANRHDEVRREIVAKAYRRRCAGVDEDVAGGGADGRRDIEPLWSIVSLPA